MGHFFPRFRSGIGSKYKFRCKKYEPKIEKFSFSQPKSLLARSEIGLLLGVRADKNRRFSSILPLGTPAFSSFLSDVTHLSAFNTVNLVKMDFCISFVSSPKAAPFLVALLIAAPKPFRASRWVLWLVNYRPLLSRFSPCGGHHPPTLTAEICRHGADDDDLRRAHVPPLDVGR